MCAVSPLFPSFGLPLEDVPMSFEQSWASNEFPSLLGFNQKDWNSLDAFGCSSPLENGLQNPPHSGGTSSDPWSTKKLNHNASERDRRKKMNTLYSTLRSLLPNTDQKKKLSIPSTISQALKYIPQLQYQVERLVQRKEEILSSINKQNDDLTCNQKPKKGQSLPTVSTSQIGDREAMIQICTSKINKSLFSELLQNLEGDELKILNASTFASTQDKVFYTLHVQVKETSRVECQVLSEKIISVC